MLFLPLFPKKHSELRPYIYTLLKHVSRYSETDSGLSESTAEETPGQVKKYAALIKHLTNMVKPDGIDSVVSICDSKTAHLDINDT